VNLRKKMLLSVGITIACLLGMIVAVSSVILKRGFAEVEDRDARQKVQRLQDTIAYEISNLSSEVNDWALWDEAYAFIEDRNSAFVERNLPNSSYLELRLNLILFLTNDGEVVFGTGFDLQKKEIVPIPKGVLDHIVTREFLGWHLDPERSIQTGTAGLFLLPEGPMLMASRAILPTAGGENAGGLLVMGRSFDEHQIKFISNLTHLAFNLQRYGEDRPSGITEALAPGHGDDPILLSKVSDDVIQGCVLLLDIYGKPALHLRLDIPREIHRLGKTSVISLVVSVLSISLIFLILALWLLEKLVLSRLLSLDRSVKAIAAGADPSMRVPSTGSDELSSLAANINGMLTALEESQRGRHEALLRFESVLQNAPLVAIQGIDRNGEICHWNNASARLYGFEASEAIGSPFQQVLSSAEAPDSRLEEALSEAWESCSVSQPMEIMVRARDGSLRWVYSSSWPLIENGRVAEVFRMDVDITERKRMEEAIEKRLLSLTRPLDAADSIEFEDLFDIEDIQKLQDQFAKATGVASIITHTDGVPITKPSGFCQLCENIIRRTEKGLRNCYHSDSVIGRLSGKGPTVEPCLSSGLWDAGASISVGGRHIANWLIGQVRDETQHESRMRAYAHEIGADETAFIEAFYEVPAMSRDQFEKIAQALFTLAGQLSSMAYQNIQQARFITERKRAEDERLKLETQLFHVQKIESVGRLAGGVAHDFNNMLGVILGYSEMALDQVPPEQPLHQHLLEIQKAANRSADLTRQLLAFARKQTVSPRVLDLNDTISGMLKMLHRLIGEDIDLFWSPGHEIWKVKVDPSQIDQILVNLTVNARDAMSETGSITIKTENVVMGPPHFPDQVGFVRGEHVLLSVSDTGEGMDQETLDHLFEPFFTTKEVGRGTGLGLATVYGIVKQNCGHICVDSRLGMGATFNIYLPRFEPDPMQTSADEIGRAPAGGMETVLLVEDDEALLNLSRGILESLGYTVLATPSPKKGLQLAEDHPGEIHLLLTDVVMPELNGRELAERVHGLRPGLKCLYTSGYTADMIAHRGILSENLHFIHKPFKRNDLARKVRDVLEKG